MVEKGKWVNEATKKQAVKSRRWKTVPHLVGFSTNKWHGENKERRNCHTKKKKKEKQNYKH